MSRTSLIFVFVAIVVLQGAWVASTQTAKPPGPLRIEKVKGDLYMISGEGGNVAVYVTSEGVVLVDDMFDRNHVDILAQVKSVTDKPLKYVLNTHQHDDHAGGDLKMLPIAEVIAHRNARANLVDIKQPYYEDTPGTPIGLPRVTFSDEMSVYLGGKEVRAKYFGRGHTSGDAIVYFPDLKTVHTGDLFLGRRAGRGGAPAPTRPPGVNIYVDYAQGGSAVYAPIGIPLAPPTPGDTIVYATCQAQFVKVAKAVVDTVGHYSRPDLFALSYHAPAHQQRAVRARRAVESLPRGELLRIADRHEVDAGAVEAAVAAGS